MTIKKTFPIREEHQIEFRIESFNIFNVTQWGRATTALNSGNFGRVGNTRPARQIQLALFYTF